MPLPAFLTSANLILCERFLLEKDEVLSAIRLIEVFVVTPPSPEAAAWEQGNPIPPNAQKLRAFVVGHIKATVGYTGTHRMSVRILNTRNEWIEMPEQIAIFSSRFADAPAAIGMIAEITVIVRNYGTNYVCLFLDDEEVARTSFTITAIPEPQA